MSKYRTRWLAMPSTLTAYHQFANMGTVMAWRREDLIAELKKLQGERTQKELAAQIGCSTAYLNDVYHGRREPGDRIATALGVERVTIYVKPGEKQKWQK